MAVEDAGEVNVLSIQLGYSLSIPETARQIETILSLDNHIAFVATSDDRITGWIHAFKAYAIESLPFAEIGGLVVEENSRGRGIGKALMAQVKDWSLQQQLFTLRVRTNVKRQEAQAFYRSLQFKEIKEQKVYQMNLAKYEDGYQG